MLLPIRPICVPARIRRDGTSPIFLQYCFYQNQRTLLNTEIAIPPNYWVKKLRIIASTLPPEYGDAGVLNQELVRQRRVVEDIVLHATKHNIEDKGDFVKTLFSPKLNLIEIGERVSSRVLAKKEAKAESLTLFSQFDDYIKSKEKKVSRATLVVYKIAKSHLKAFEKYRKEKIDFSSLDYGFYEDFMTYLTFEHLHMRRNVEVKGLKANSSAKTIKHLRGFVKDRVKRKIIAPIDLSDFKVVEEEIDAIYLNREEISALYALDLTRHPHLIEYRDMLVLGCLTGLRFSDFSTLRPEDLQNDMIYKKQEKSNHWVVIPLRPEAREIFSRQFQNKVLSLTNPEFNRHIKTVGQLCGFNQPIKFSFRKGNRQIEVTRPKYEWITSHTARRSFCTNEFLAGTPVELIMKISGHKRTKDFYKYIRVSPEEAANKIRQIWDTRAILEAAKGSSS